MILPGTILNNRFTILDTIAEGGMSTIYKAQDLQNENNVALKIIEGSKFSLKGDDLIRFRTEIEAAYGISHDNIIKILDHGQFEAPDIGSGLYIALEYLDWVNLKDVLESDTALSFDTAINLAIQLCRALEEVHRLNIIHGDIKPSNIILDTHHSGSPVKLIDFGLARIKAQSHSSTYGTFLYMSPEQAGLLRHTVDERSDLYSLGIVLYQLITGRLPFESNTLVDLFHQQLTVMPLSPSQLQEHIPPVMDKIIFKLLDKEPEKRYQSATGLQADLELVQQGEQTFIPGLKDLPLRIDSTRSFIGREKELGKLIKFAERKDSGITCIGGEAGIGKSRLVEQFSQYVLSKNILSIESRSYNKASKEPYAPLKDILTGFVHNFYRYPVEKQKLISSALRKSCGDLGNIINEFNPLIKAIIGEFPPQVTLEPETEKRRFNLVISRFINSIAEAEEGLIIILEDLHWSDTGTIEILLEIMNSITSSQLKIITTLRETEFKKRDDMAGISEEFVNSIQPDSWIHLGPLDEEEVNNFIPSIISEHEKRKQLSSVIYQKSQGNPLFTTEIIKYLIANNIFIKSKTGWSIDIHKIDNITIPDSLIKIILTRTSLFNNDEIDILASAAVIGRVFDYETLVQLEQARNKSEANETFIIKTLDKAILHHIIEETPRQQEFMFTHDRIHDSFYNQNQNKEKAKLHLLLARIIENSPDNTADEHLFSLAHNYIAAKKEDKILEYALPAANRARENYAYKDAISYYNTIMNILDKKTSQDFNTPDRKLWIECIDGLGYSYAHAGDPVKALELFNELIKHIETPLEKSKIYKQMSRASFRKGDLELSEKYVKIGLKLLGEKMPVSKKEAFLFTLKELFLFFINHIFPSRPILPRTKKRSEKVKTIIKLYEWLNWVYFFGESWKMPRTVFRMLNISRKIPGTSRELASSFYYYGFFCVAMGWFKNAQRYLNESHRLMVQLNDKLGIAQCLGGWGIYYVMRGEFDKSIEASSKSIEILESIGDFVEIVKSGQFLFTSYFLKSEYENAQKIYDKYHKYLKNIFEDLTYSSFAFPIIYYIETGTYDKAKELLEKFMPYQKQLKTWYLYYTYCSLYGYCLYDEGDIEKSLAYFNTADELNKIHYFPKHTHMLYQHYAEAMIADYNGRKMSLSKNEKNIYLKKIKKTCHKAITHSKSWYFSYDIALRAMAKYYLLTNNHKKTEKYFTMSIAHSRKIGRRYELARSLYEYALFLYNHGDRNRARETFFSSYTIFTELEISKYRDLISKTLGLESEKNNKLTDTIYAEKKQYVLDKSQEIIQITGLDEIFKTALAVAMTITGASSGHLFLFDEDREQLVHTASEVMHPGTEEAYSLTIARKVFESGEALITTSALDDEDLRLARSVQAGELKSIACVPLRYNELINGVCYLDNPLARGVFIQENIELLKIYLSSVVLAIENKLLHNKLDERKGAKNKIDSSDPGGRYITRAQEYIHNNFMDKITRETVAEVLDINADYFGKIFKTYTGKSFKEYLNEIRVKSTLEKLANTDTKIIDIAYEAGFESLRSFYRIFYGIMGETPTSYREKNSHT